MVVIEKIRNINNFANGKKLHRLALNIKIKTVQNLEKVANLCDKLGGIDEFGASIRDSLQSLSLSVVDEILILHVVTAANHKQHHVLRRRLTQSSGSDAKSH